MEIKPGNSKCELQHSKEYKAVVKKRRVWPGHSEALTNCYNVTIRSPRAPPVCRQMLPIETNVKRLLIKQPSNKTMAINPQIHVINQRAKNKHAHHHTLLNTHTSLFWQTSLEALFKVTGCPRCGKVTGWYICCAIVLECMYMFVVNI